MHHLRRWRPLAVRLSSPFLSRRDRYLKMPTARHGPRVANPAARRGFTNFAREFLRNSEHLNKLLSFFLNCDVLAIE